MVVKLETAILAKECGFNISPDTFPEQAELQAWLRNVHNIHVNLIWVGKGYDVTVKRNPNKIENESKVIYLTYEEALEEGLLFALNLLYG